MSTPSEVLADAIAPAKKLLPTLPFTDAVCVLMLAIGLQESGLIVRRQYGNGPARGLWQNEKGTASTRGGVTGIMMHPASMGLAKTVCISRNVAWDATAIWSALETDDVLAAAFARLLLWTDSHAVPERGDSDGAYAYYYRNWRPGRPHVQDWLANYSKAVQAVIGAEQ